MTNLQPRFLVLAALALPSVLGAFQNRFEVLQAQGIARLDQVHDQFRREGMSAPLLNQLDTAASELALSYQGFAAASNFPQAAWSLVKLADSERQLALLSRLTEATQAQGGNPRADALARSARDHYQEAANLARKTGRNLYLVKALTGRALLEETAFHDYGSANVLVSEALRAASSCPDPQPCQLDALENKVNLETGRGELFSAASHANGLLALLKRARDPEMEYRAYSDKGDIYRALADGCSDSYEKSPDVCYRLFDLSKADLVKARDIAAQAGFTYFASASEMGLQQVDLLRNMTQRYNSHAEIPTGMFDPKTAKDVLATDILPIGPLPQDQAAGIKRLYDTAGPSLPGALATYLRASVDDIQGRTDAALEGYLRAVQTVEDERQKVGEDSARSSFLDDKVSYYDRPILMLLFKKRYAEAFRLIESTRARVTAELLSTKSVALSKPVDRKLFSTLALKRAQIASMQTRFFTDVFSPDTGSDDDADTVAKAQTRLTDLEEEYEQLLLRIGREAPRTQDVAVSRPASLDAVQAMVRQDQSDVLYYYLRDTALILIHIGPDSLQVRNIFLPRYELKAKVADLINSMRKQGTPFRDDLAKQLFLYLIQPVTEWLRTDRLIVIPQGELASLPFQALEDPADGTFAGERFRITYAPSASILLQLKKQGPLAKASLLAAADPSLPGASQEVNSLARLYPARQKVVADSLITKGSLLQSTGSYDILHLAVHGEFDGQEPLLSHVNLAPAGGEGALTAAEMFSMPLDNTKLVTLSACESGRVRTTRANDIQGIQQALLFAGAQSLLVSAWKVDSDPTSMWMQAFYREAQNQAPPEAAREAIRSMRRNPAFRHPHYWAPFLLIAR